MSRPEGELMIYRVRGGHALATKPTRHGVMLCRCNRERKSRTSLQNKVRLKVLPEQLTLFANTSVTFKNASFNSFLLHGPDYCSEIHVLSYTSNEKYR